MLDTIEQLQNKGCKNLCNRLSAFPCFASEQAGVNAHFDDKRNRAKRNTVNRLNQPDFQVDEREHGAFGGVRHCGDKLHHECVFFELKGTTSCTSSCRRCRQS